jgi:hypothetical protein
LIYFGFCSYNHNGAALIFKYNKMFIFECIKDNEVPVIKIQGNIEILSWILYPINILLKWNLLVQAE